MQHFFINCFITTVRFDTWNPCADVGVILSIFSHPCKGLVAPAGKVKFLLCLVLVFSSIVAELKHWRPPLTWG